MLSKTSMSLQNCQRRHLTNPTKVVDNFGIKYVGKEHADHLINCLKEKYKHTKDWAGDLYCGISLKWDYGARALNISMPGYIKKQLLKYEHIMQQVQHCQYSPEPKSYGINAQSPLPQEICGNSTIKRLNRYRKLWAAYYTTRGRSI
jgi:hypothetical protein